MRTVRPRGDGFWPDVVGALGLLAVAAIGVHLPDGDSSVRGAHETPIH